MSAVDVDDVETGSLRSPRRLYPLALHSPDVRHLHGLRCDGLVIPGDLGGSEGRKAGLPVARVDASMMQLDAGEGTVGVHLVAHDAERTHVVVVPEPARRLGRLGADRAELGADRRPSAFGLHRSVPCLRPGFHLIEPVAEDLRPDRDRLEEDVMPRVARHDSLPLPFDRLA